MDQAGRKDTALRMYNRLPRRQDSHWCSQMWNCSGGRRRGWWVAAFDVRISIRGPSLMYHPTFSRTFLRGVRQPFDSFLVWQMFVRFPRNRFFSMNMHRCRPEKETRKMKASSPDIGWAEPDISREDAVEQGIILWVKLRASFLQFPRSKCNSWNDPYAWSRELQDILLIQVRRSLKRGVAQTANYLQNPILAQSR